MKPVAKRRIFELDLLRGLFIIIIIIDHLQFWPSPLRYITGEGRLWVTAAEGFFLISGLLIGYIRAYKGKSKSLRDISVLLSKRAGLLYLWGVMITLAVTLFALFVGGHELLPKLPSSEQLTSPATFIWSILSMQYFNDWIYFLRLYAIMLLATPIFLWILRKGYDRIIPFIIVTLYIAGFAIPEGSLQWQALFFGAALIGYRLEDIKSWMQNNPAIRKILSFSVIALTLVTMTISFFFVHGWVKVEDPHWDLMDRDTYVDIRTHIDPFFTLSPLAPGRVMLAFLWFAGLLLAFNLLSRQIMKTFGWLLIPLGEKSLSAYCLQALILPIVVVVLAPSGELFNTTIGILVVLAIWWLLRIKWVGKIIPR
ncbi:succinyl transferase OpgC [Candidatus Saccharibacteria bacterium]|jgi:hypothetical protein|nr:succinyl transferase OpgC [Candidatus Saccharibacteria bacterium]